MTHFTQQNSNIKDQVTDMFR